MAERPAPIGPGPTTRDLEAAKAFGLSVNGLTPVDIGKVGLPGDLYLTHGHVGPTLPAMPDDILFQIWCEVEDPRPLVKTCQRLHSLSRLVDLRAQWLLSRYEAYEVIYEAICRPSLFDAWLLRTLLNRGAKLSRALVQEVAYRSVCHIEHDWKNEYCGMNLRWGTKLSAPAVYAVLNEGYRLYGSNVNLKTRDNDIFCGALFAQSAVLMADLKSLFEDYDFMPLPACGNMVLRSGLVKSMGRYGTPPQGHWLAYVTLLGRPALALRLAQQRGFRPHLMTRLGDWICNKVLSGVEPFDTVTNPVLEIEALQREGRAVLSRACAATIICSLRLPLSKEYPAPILKDIDASGREMLCYATLLMLEDRGSLHFSLSELLREMMAKFATRPEDVTLGHLYRHLELEFETIDGTHEVAMTTFWQAQQDDRSLAWVQEKLGRRQVRIDTLRLILLGNFQRSSLPAQYAYSKLGKPYGRQLICEVLPLLVRQPHKGALLRNLCATSNGVEECRIDCLNALSIIIRGAGLSDAHVAPQIWRLYMRWEPAVNGPAHMAAQYRRSQCSYLALENDQLSRAKKSNGDPVPYGRTWPLVQGLSSADECVIAFERSPYLGDVESFTLSSVDEDVLIPERSTHAGDVESLTLSSAREVKPARNPVTFKGITKICIYCHSAHLWSDGCAGSREDVVTSAEESRWRALHALQVYEPTQDHSTEMGPNGTPPLSELRAAANASPIQYLKMQETAARRDTHLSFFGRRSQHETCEDVVEANLPLFARDAAPPVIQSIGAAICDLFDPTSLEADVLAQHSLIYNSFELRPVTKPFDKELPVTLQHFRLVMLQSAAIPAIFFNQIIAGCPFKVNWHASTNMPDMELLNRAAAATGISDDIRNQIAALAISSQKEETQIDIEVSGTYQSILIKRACFEPSEMKRPDIIKPSPTSLPQQDAAREPQEKYEQLSAGFDSPADRQSPLSSLEASALSVMSDSASSSSFKSGTSDTSHFYFGRFENKPIRISRSKSTELLKGLELWIKHLDALLKLESHRVEILQSIGASDGSSDGPRWRSARNKREPFQNQAQVALKRGVQRLKRYRKALIAAKKVQSPSKTRILAELADLWADLEQQAAVEPQLRNLPEMVSTLLSSKDRQTRTGRCPKTRYSMGYVLPRDLSDEDDDPNFDNLLSSESEATSDSSLELPSQCESAKARRRSRASLPKRKCEQSQSDADADEPSTSIQLRPESSAKSRAKRASKRAKLKGDPYESSSLSSLGED